MGRWKELSHCEQKAHVWEHSAFWDCRSCSLFYFFYFIFFLYECLAEGSIRDCTCQWSDDGIKLTITNASGEPPLVNFSEHVWERQPIRLPPLSSWWWAEPSGAPLESFLIQHQAVLRAAVIPVTLTFLLTRGRDNNRSDRLLLQKCLLHS